MSSDECKCNLLYEKICSLHSVYIAITTVYGREFQSLMDHLEDQIAIVQMVLEYLKKGKKFVSSHSSSYIHKMKKLLNMLYKARTLLLQRKSSVKRIEYLANLKINSLFQQYSQQYRNNDLTAYLPTVVFTFVVMCAVTLLTKQEEIISISVEEKTFNGQSVKEIIKQCLSFDYENHTEIIQAYPVGLVTSSKPKKRVQDNTHHGMYIF